MKTGNYRRYYLHRKIKQEDTDAHVKSQRKTIYVSCEEDITPVVKELQTKFGYSIQYEIPQ